MKSCILILCQKVYLLVKHISFIVSFNYKSHLFSKPVKWKTLESVMKKVREHRRSTAANYAQSIMDKRTTSERKRPLMVALLRASNKINKGEHCKSVMLPDYYFGRCIAFTMSKAEGIFAWLFMLSLSNRGSFKMMEIPKE